jgi:hypothetical protein
MKRVSIVISDEEQIRLHNSIPWGITNRILRVLLFKTLDLIDEHGEIVLGAIISGKLSALDILLKGDTDGIRRPER